MINSFRINKILFEQQHENGVIPLLAGNMGFVLPPAICISHIPFKMRAVGVSVESCHRRVLVGRGKAHLVSTRFH